MKPQFFTTPIEFRKWLEQHHAKEKELFVGYYKTSSGKPSITWPESVKEALCFGWIDGVRKGIDDEIYTIRFTPRKTGSTWSAVNIKYVEELTKKRLMHPAGLAAFQARKENKSAIYSYEQKEVALASVYEKQLKANAKAWEFFQNKPLSYRKPAIHWIMSAKQEETRVRRLEQLIKDSEQGRTVPPLTPRLRKK